MKIKLMAALAAVALALGGVVALAAPAGATGSDAPTPYTVGADGIHLPAGSTFSDNGHVNIKTTTGDYGIHFESLNNQPSGKWIGKLPATGGDNAVPLIAGAFGVAVIALGTLLTIRRRRQN